MSLRQRRARILATLGPASSTETQIEALVAAGADVFRLNFSHGSHEDHAERYACIRRVEQKIGRPLGVLMDLQGPKLRVGTFAAGRVTLVAGTAFRLDMNPQAGDEQRVCLPHPEIFAALEPETDLLLDDGKLRLKVKRCGADFAETEVLVGGVLSDRKGVNVPGVLLPISALTEKDRRDLDFGLQLGVDWVALSFVQRPEDVTEAKALVGDRAWVMAKLEKPSAIEHLNAIVAAADGIMVARGDLGVELPAPQVPVLQKRIVAASRRAGKPVVVATQMLESMIKAPVPTRAEASDVATAIYDGVDAVMLSAESAAGDYPCEAVAMMHSIIHEVEADPGWRSNWHGSRNAQRQSTPDAICSAMWDVAEYSGCAATVAFSVSGFSVLRAARERPRTPVLGLTPDPAIARRLALVWGVHPVVSEPLDSVDHMIHCACEVARQQGLADTGATLVVIGGIPFGQVGSTNLLHIARV
ncbi:pyruvate kinase [Marinospirillum alkaliphilum]|uniref:Pyruvate kinase n=1 Tax=Marinospirillum alkaliphilum DSM 21637 TaxID=1122209 RepID=A0A1K1YV12_9GAMM|nr:pyruvate kinase [Marinospirillum alkaliphilum]SFX65785.1 pyruvate kinase [Marinospirillum alkaliphilum DSM 21637]